MVERVIFQIISILIISFHSLTAQQNSVTYQDIGVLEEYTNPQVTSLYQDRRGLLWISTYGGMDRWDGRRMVHYPYMPFASTSSPARTPQGFTDDDQNNIWLVGDCLMRFDLKTEIFHSIPLTYKGTDLTIRSIKYDPKGFLWVGAMEGMFQFYPDFDSIIHIPVLDIDEVEGSYFRMVSILQDSTGRVWMSHNQHGLCFYDSINGVFRTEPLDLPEFVDKHMNVGSMKEDPHGNFWLFGRKAELAMFNPYTRTFQWAGLPVYSKIAPSSWGGIAIDHQGMIWFGTDRGLMLYDPVKKTLTRLDTPKSLAYVIDMITDKQGNIIVGTLEGAMIINPLKNAIRTIDVHLDQLVEGVAWHISVVRDEQFLWMGMFKAGLVRYNLETEQVVNFQADGQPGSINSNYVTKTLRDRSGRIWFTAGWNGSLYRVKADNNSFEHFQVGQSHMITPCDSGFFWILGMDHIVRFDPLTLDSVHITFKKPLPYNYLGGQLDFTPFIRDKEGIFWFAQNDEGLVRIDPVSREWTHYNYDQNNPAGLPDRHVKSLFCDSRGTIWLSTWVGLSRLIRDPDSDTTLSFDNHYIADLKLGHTSRITEDDSGNLFVGNLNGVVVIGPDGSVETYTKHDGLLVDPGRTWMVDRDHENGNIYLGGSKMVVVPPGMLAPDTNNPQTILTEFRILGKTIIPGEESPLKSSILVADRINLRHDQNFFRIDFTATQLTHPERNRFRYILEGIDQDTVYSGNLSFAEYTDLAPGNYTFWVAGASHRGPWDQKGRSIKIIIHPPWYRSMVALIIWGCLLIMLIMGIIRIRTRMLWIAKTQLEIEVENRMNEIQWMNEQIIEMEAMKTRFFYNISHEFRNLISLISAPIECVREDSKISNRCRIKLDVARRNAFKLTSLVDQLLDISKIDKGSLKLVLTRTRIYNFVHAIAVSFVSLAETKGIHYIFNIPSTELEEWFDTNKLEKITNNLLSNAFKFTDEGGMVVLDMGIKSKQNGFDEVMEIVVRDTGSGIPKGEHEKIFNRFYQAESTLSKEGGGAGIGLALTSDLIDLMHGTIILESEVGIGSTFKVQIPLGKEHLIENEFSISTSELEMGTRGSTSVFMQKDTLECEFEQKQEEFIPDEAPLILVVEDNREIRSLISRYLEAHFRVIEAVDGSAGLKIAIDKLPDLVLTDLIMPRMDGIEMCSYLKTDLRTSHIPVIMLTAKSTRDNRLEGLETGADDYLSKPFDMKEVVARINNLVEQRKKLKEKFCQTISLETHDVFVSSMDQKFLTQVLEVIENHMSSEKFDVGELCRELNISRSTLSRKLNALTGLSPLEFIRNSRLERAASLLNQQFGNITQVALEVGFSNPSYFTRMFRKTYKVSPSEYAKKQV